RESCRRLIEMALLVPALTEMTPKEIRKRFSVSTAFRNVLARWSTPSNQANPVVFFTPHFTLAEALVVLPAIVEVTPGTFHAVYRPLKQAGIDRWLLRARVRFGVNLLSKRSGLLTAGRAVAGGGGVCILFDQNASVTGTLLTFMDRVASATDLPGFDRK